MDKYNKCGQATMKAVPYGNRKKQKRPILLEFIWFLL